MKRLLFIALLFCTVCCVSASKRALMIGVGNYPASTGWSKISSSNDIDLLKPVLQKAGFSVTTLVDAQATHQGIVNALDKLTKQARKKDIILIHFSCHGQQMDSFSDAEDDGLDEAMIPYDALREPSKTYQGENHLRDKELDIYLTKLRKKIGPNGQLLVILDACHSGDATRGEDDDVLLDPEVGHERGVSDIFSSKNPNRQAKQLAKHTFSKRSRSQGYAPIIALSACKPEQRSYEYRDPKTKTCYGSLSYLVWKELTNLKKIDFARLAKAVIDNKSFTMKKYQQPYMLVE